MVAQKRGTPAARRIPERFQTALRLLTGGRTSRGARVGLSGGSLAAGQDGSPNIMMTLCFWTRIFCGAALLAVVPAVHAQDVPLSLDDEYAQMAGRIPGFGGLYIDERGTTHVYLQDVTRAGEMRGLGDRVVFQQGDYDFRDLQAWKDQVRPQLAATGAVYLDIDERRNRLVFGVERESVDRFTEELRRFLSGTRVPPEAVIVEAAEPIQPMALLTDTTRPVPAGVQVTNSSGGGCTLGANVVRAGVKRFHHRFALHQGTWASSTAPLCFRARPRRAIRSASRPPIRRFSPVAPAPRGGGAGARMRHFSPMAPPAFPRVGRSPIPSSGGLAPALC